MPEKIAKWLIFSVLMALIPIFGSALSLFSHGSAVKPEALIGRGELLIIAAALCARSVGELIGSSSKKIVLRLITGGATLFLLFISAFYFSDITSSYRSQVSLDVSAVCTASMILYASSVASGLGCVVASEV